MALPGLSRDALMNSLIGAVGVDDTSTAEVTIERRTAVTLEVASAGEAPQVEDYLPNVEAALCASHAAGECTLALASAMEERTRRLSSASYHMVHLVFSIVLGINETLAMEANATHTLVSLLSASIAHALNASNISLSVPVTSTLSATVRFLSLGSAEQASSLVNTTLSSATLTSAIATSLGISPSSVLVSAATVALPPQAPPTSPSQPAQPPPSGPPASALLLSRPPALPATPASPSAIIVTTTNELRAALRVTGGHTSPSGRLVVLIAMPYLSLGGAELLVEAADVLVLGSTPNGTVLDARGASRHVRLEAGRKLELRALTLVDGLATTNSSDVDGLASPLAGLACGGSAIVGDGSTLILAACEIRNCRTPELPGGSIQWTTEGWQYGLGLHGGAIYAEHGTIELHGTTIRDCWAAAEGGAIACFSYATAKIDTSSVISNCSACVGGGAVFGHGYSTVTIHNSTIADCHARWPWLIGDTLHVLTSSRRSTRGGAVLLRENSHGELDGCRVTGCTAEAGGALAATRFCTMLVSATAIVECSALDYSADGLTALEAGEPVGLGGTVHGCCESSLTVVRSTFVGGHAAVAGGAISLSAELIISQTVISHCNSQVGGALHLPQVSNQVPPVVSLMDVQLRQNKAGAGAAIAAGAERRMQGALLLIEHDCASTFTNNNSTLVDVPPERPLLSIRNLTVILNANTSSAGECSADQSHALLSNLNTSIRLPTCEDASFVDYTDTLPTPVDLCDVTAECHDMQVAIGTESRPSLRTATCMCSEATGAYSNLLAPHAPLAPYMHGQGCTLPVMAQSLLHVQSEVLLYLDKGVGGAATVDFELMLTLNGTDDSHSNAWAASIVGINATWLQLLLPSQILPPVTPPAGMEAVIPLRASAAGLRDRSVHSATVLVHVQLGEGRERWLSAPVRASVHAQLVRSLCILSAEPTPQEPTPQAAATLKLSGTVGSVVTFFLFARDADGLTLDRSGDYEIEAVVTTDLAVLAGSNASAVATRTATYDGSGRWHINVAVQALANYTVHVSILSFEDMHSPRRLAQSAHITTHCGPQLAAVIASHSCGCDVGLKPWPNPMAGDAPCVACPIGEFKDSTGNGGCEPCPMGATTLAEGSISRASCVCQAGLYQAVSSSGTFPTVALGEEAGVAVLFECLRCPVGVWCPRGTTLQTIHTLPGFYRPSRGSTDVRPCDDADGCGSIGAGASSADGCSSGCTGGEDPAQQCHATLTGVFCKLCWNETGSYYVPGSRSEAAQCRNCPTNIVTGIYWPIGVALVILILAAATLAASRAARAMQSSRFKTKTSVRMMASVASMVTTKAKILIGFYQIACAIPGVYRVTCGPIVSAVLSMAQAVITLGLDSVLLVNLQCLGAHRFEAKLLFWLLAPLALALVCVATSLCTSSGVPVRGNGAICAAAKRTAPSVLYIFFLAAPVVTKVAFAAFPCWHFAEGSVLRADVSVACGSTEHAHIQSLAWAAILLYPVSGWMAIAAALYATRGAILSDGASEWSDALAFMHADYKPTAAAFGWELAELLRRFLLVGLLGIVRPGHVVQALLATLYCLLHLVVQLMASPWRQPMDAVVALAASLALLLFFISAIVLKLQQSVKLVEQSAAPDAVAAASPAVEEALISPSLLDGLMLVSVLGALLIAALLLVRQSAAERQRLARDELVARTRRLRYVRNGAEVRAPPIGSGGYHLFLSHVWGTGQDQMRIIKQRLLEMIADLSVFLDVDDLEDISDLEGYIERTKVVLIFCSQGYFESKNCMRELVSSARKGKALLPLVEEQGRHGGLSIEDVCERLHAAGDSYAKWGFDATAPRGNALVSALLGQSNEPLEWNRLGVFQDVSLRLVAEATLRATSAVVGLLQPVFVQGEVAQLRVNLGAPRAGRKFHIYCSPFNAGALELADELTDERGLKIECADDASQLEECEHMLVYLHALTWTSGKASDELASEVAAAMGARVHVLLAHEMPGAGGQAARHAVAFGSFFSTTPQSLLTRGIYDQIAVPLKGGEWRKASLALLAKALAAPLPESNSKHIQWTTSRALERLSMATREDAIEEAIEGGAAANASVTTASHMPRASAVRNFMPMPRLSRAMMPRVRVPKHATEHKLSAERNSGHLPRDMQIQAGDGSGATRAPSSQELVKPRAPVLTDRSLVMRSVVSQPAAASASENASLTLPQAQALPQSTVSSVYPQSSTGPALMPRPGSALRPMTASTTSSTSATSSSSHHEIHVTQDANAGLAFSSCERASACLPVSGTSIWHERRQSSGIL